MKINYPKPIPQSVIIQPSHGWLALKLRTVWRYRELLYFLVWRDVKVRYKQTALGVTWVLLQPILSTVVFSGLFGILLDVPTGEIPYPLFAMSGLVVWQYFTGALNRSSTSLVDSTSLITKVYFPRLIIPLSTVLGGLLDFAISFLALFGLLLLYRIRFNWAILTLPLFLLLGVITALGYGLWFTALNVRYRDVKHLMPFVVQIWMYLTPVVYSIELIPPRFRWLLSLNPMTGVVAGFRWALLGSPFPQAGNTAIIFSISILMTVIVLVGGLMYFVKTERTFADII